MVLLYCTHTHTYRRPYGYTPARIHRFECHINVELCNSIQCVKYLYKYVYKGYDRIMYAIQRSDEEQQREARRRRGDFVPTDEVTKYRDARYITTSEAVWRTFEFSMSGMSPTVIRLDVHDEGEQQVHTRIHTRTYSHTNLRAHIFTPTHIHTLTHIHTRAHIHTRTNTHTHARTLTPPTHNTHIHTRAHIHTRTNTHTRTHTRSHHPPTTHIGYIRWWWGRGRNSP